MEDRKTALNDSWSNQYATHPVLGIVFFPNIVFVIVAMILVMSGVVSAANDWLFLASLIVPTTTLCIAGWIALYRPAPKRVNGHWDS